MDGWQHMHFVMMSGLAIDTGFEYTKFIGNGELALKLAESRLIGLDPKPDLDNANVGKYRSSFNCTCMAGTVFLCILSAFISTINRGHHSLSYEHVSHAGAG